MNKIIKKLEKHSLSDNELLELVSNKANLLTYTEVSKINTMDELLGPYGACIILYLSKHNYGHWCCIFLVGSNELEFFDPYGTYIDFQLKHIPEYFRKVSGQMCPHLSCLMINSPYLLSYNEYKFQKHEKDISTCGRHVAIRLILRKLDLESYKDFITSTPNDPDYVVTMLTAFI
jgi:hypothetical protein